MQAASSSPAATRHNGSPPAGFRAELATYSSGQCSTPIVSGTQTPGSSSSSGLSNVQQVGAAATPRQPFQPLDNLKMFGCDCSTGLRSMSARSKRHAGQACQQPARCASAPGKDAVGRRLSISSVLASPPSLPRTSFAPQGAAGAVISTYCHKPATVQAKPQRYQAGAIHKRNCSGELGSVGTAQHVHLQRVEAAYQPRQQSSCRCVTSDCSSSSSSSSASESADSQAESGRDTCSTRCGSVLCA